MRPIVFNPASDDSFRLSQSWLQTCLQTHEKCPHPRGDFKPTRVIEIQRVEAKFTLRLLETLSKTTEPYVALSYCWGGEGHVKTTSKDIGQRLSGIDINDLPATIKDAILLTERLGIRQLWVDALCIIQDDDKDKTSEIIQMPLIYSQATVTIIASRASSVQEGFLHGRTPWNSDTNKAFELPYKCISGETESVLLHRMIEEATEPLDYRAWALQERILSPRILEYGSLQTRWVCCHNIPPVSGVTDGFKAVSIYNEERWDYLFTIALQAILNITDITDLDPTHPEHPPTQWHNLVRVYTHRKLTEPTDRIPAITGIASRFGRILRDDYCAGLWKSNLVKELL